MTITSIRDDIQQTRPFRSTSQEAYLALLRTADGARRHVSTVLEERHITLQQYNVLRILRGAGDSGLPTLAIGERMIERTPGITRLIDRMEVKGWVSRRRCTEDRRRVWCQISETGLTVLDDLDEPIATLDEVLQHALAPEELRDLIGYLDRIRAVVGESHD